VCYAFAALLFATSPPFFFFFKKKGEGLIAIATHGLYGHRTSSLLLVLYHHIPRNKIWQMANGKQPPTILWEETKGPALKRQSEHHISIFELKLTEDAPRIPLEEIMSKGVTNTEAGSSIDHVKESVLALQSFQCIGR
jgi:hypothetical protein